MTIRRRPRGTRIDPAPLGWVIERPKKDRLAQWAEHAGVSNAQFLEAMIDHVGTEINDRGIPTWWPTQPERADGELPIDTA